jgi:hypothetical protein
MLVTCYLQAAAAAALHSRRQLLLMLLQPCVILWSAHLPSDVTTNPCCLLSCCYQVVLEGASANITMFNVALENLAYGNEASGILAEFTSILLPSQLWAFQYRR